VEPVVAEDSMKYKAGSGRLVAGSNRAFGGETAKEPPDLHEIAGESDDLRLLRITTENGGGDRILMNVETDPGRLRHGWTLLGKLSVLMHHSCGSDQLPLSNPR
jgi:hypothetical protein